MKRFIPLAVVLLLLTGALGLKTEQMCNSDPKINTDPALLMKCYYAAGMTHAYQNQPRQARQTCADIYTLGTAYPADSDARQKAQLLMQGCFFDVAKVLARSDPAEASNTCGYINQVDTVGTKLFGAKVTQEACYAAVYKLSLAEYTSANNFCSLIFVLPLLAFASIKIRGRP